MSIYKEFEFENKIITGPDSLTIMISVVYKLYHSV